MPQTFVALLLYFCFVRFIFIFLNISFYVTSTININMLVTADIRHLLLGVHKPRATNKAESRADKSLRKNHKVQAKVFGQKRATLAKS